MVAKIVLPLLVLSLILLGGCSNQEELNILNQTYETKLQELKQNHQNEILSLNKTYQENLTNLKTDYENRLKGLNQTVNEQKTQSREDIDQVIERKNQILQNQSQTIQNLTKCKEEGVEIVKILWQLYVESIDLYVDDKIG